MCTPPQQRADEQALAALQSQTQRWDLSAEELRRQAPDLLVREQAWQGKMDIWRAKAVYDAQTFWLATVLFLFLTPIGWLLLLIVGHILTSPFR